jgi:hypothetical protein
MRLLRQHLLQLLHQQQLHLQLLHQQLLLLPLK